MGNGSQPQLRMMVTDLRYLPPVQLPDGYELAVMEPGREQDWIDVLNGALNMGHWTIEKARACLSGSPAHVMRDGIHIVSRCGTPVATACFTMHDDTGEAELGWVACLPEHRGRNVGYQVCLATLRHIAGRGFGSAFLLTDDERLPAIRTYLRLGFRPLITDISHAERWQRILAQIRGAEELLALPFASGPGH